MRFSQAGPGRYRDDCEVWAATLEGFEPSGSCRALIRMRPVVKGRLNWKKATRLMLRTLSATALALEDAMLVHGCALVPPGGDGAYLFVGRSGAGKTTMVERLPGWDLLGDDTVVVDVASDGRVHVAGSPFPGKEGKPRRARRVSLDRIFVLAPGATGASLRPLDLAGAFAEVQPRVFWCVDDGPLVPHVLDLVERVVRGVPVHVLATNLEHDVEGLLGDLKDAA